MHYILERGFDDICIVCYWEVLMRSWLFVIGRFRFRLDTFTLDNICAVSFREAFHKSALSAIGRFRWDPHCLLQGGFDDICTVCYTESLMVPTLSIVGRVRWDPYCLRRPVSGTRGSQYGWHPVHTDARLPTSDTRWHSYVEAGPESQAEGGWQVQQENNPTLLYQWGGTDRHSAG